MSKEQKTLKSCYILDRLREWFELYGNQNHQRAEEELHLAIDELYEYQQKDQQLADLEANLAEKDKEIKYQENMKILAVANQNKKAIEQLEKVKEKLNDYDIQDILSSSSDPYGEFDENCVTTEKINKIIDNQINELKGEKYD